MVFKTPVSLLFVRSIISGKIFNGEKLIKNGGIVFYSKDKVGTSISPRFSNNLCNHVNVISTIHWTLSSTQSV